MNIRTRKIFWGTILMLTVLACSLPANLIPGTEPTATVSPTTTPTVTPTFTKTNTPSQTPTPTITSSPTPIPVTVQTQEDGTLLVVDPVCGYQFILPNKWESVPQGSNQAVAYRFEANYPGNSGKMISLRVTADYATRSLESELEKYVSIAKTGFGFAILNRGIVSNIYNTKVAYLEFRGTFNKLPIHTYELFFVSNGNSVHLTFDFDETLYTIAQQTVMTTRNSIQLIVP